MASQSKRVLQSEIATALGLSQGTVSLALKGDPRVAVKTREAVRKKAEEIGYVPDPSLVALAQYRNNKAKKDQFTAGLAWLTNFSTEEGWKENRMLRLYRKGAEEGASRLGFRLYDFWLNDPAMSFSRLHDILIARGIRGVILPPQEDFGTKIDFDLTDFAAVTLGYTLESPKLHRVGNNVFGSVQMAYRKLQDKGYERIALVIDEDVDCRVNRAFSAGFASMCNKQELQDAIPVFVCEGFDRELFNDWCNRWSPEVLMGTGPAFEAAVGEWFLREGESPAVAELNLNDGLGTYAGIDQQLELIGKTAVSLVFSQLSHFEYGIPQTPLLTLVDGVWRDGQSLPRKGE